MYARYIPPVKAQNAPNGTEHRAVSSPAGKSDNVPASSPSALASQASTQVGSAGFTYSRYIPGSKVQTTLPQTNTIHRFDDEDIPSPAGSKRKRDQTIESQDPPTTKSKKSKSSKAPIGALEGSSGPGDVNGVVESRVESKLKPGKKEKKPKKSTKSKEPKGYDSPEPADEPQGDLTKVTSHKSKKKKDRSIEDDNSAAENAQDVARPDVSAEGDKGPSADNNNPSKTKEGKKKRDKQKKKKEPLPQIQSESESDHNERHRGLLERREKSLKFASETVLREEERSEEEPGEIHDLEPLPQPALVSAETPQPTYETLPSWLAAPIRVSHSSRKPFSELGLLSKTARVLEEKGFPEAFAVQTAAIPLLLPTSKQHPGDLLISAATGSGKTLAYALPIVRDLSQGLVTRLRTLVVLPTRELVKQAQEVFELCARAHEGGERKKVRIGVAIGSQTLKSEQAAFVGSETRFDPTMFEKIQKQHSSISTTSNEAGPGGADLRLGRWKGEVVDFTSKVDVLICTPGRLVEHLEQTPGFCLDYVRWLVVDEADKLLAQSFQGWLDVVIDKFKTSKFTAREFPGMDLDGVRKVILSATLTRDLSLLNQLALRRPQLIVLDDDGETQLAEHSLPMELQEFAIRVHNTNLKPLYLLDLLKSEHMAPATSDDTAGAADSDTTSEAGSESDSESESDSDSDSSSDTSSDSSSSDESMADAPKPNGAQAPMKSALPIALIFTKSNEAALRLSRLLALIDPSLERHISTLTSTTPTHIRRKTLKAFTTPSSPIRLIIASDLVARGIDLPELGHVVNYDLPPSTASYVHRVGRTARAGRAGRAWTLVGDDESGWFWGKIAKSSGVRRAQKVSRVRIEEMSEERVESYESALEKLAQEALDTKRR